VATPHASAGLGDDARLPMRMASMIWPSVVHQYRRRVIDSAAEIDSRRAVLRKPLAKYGDNLPT
jgi:hypothetical protein